MSNILIKEANDTIIELLSQYNANQLVILFIFLFFRSFLTELSNILINEANDTIIGLLGRYNADQLEIPDEELWQVEAPVWPEPEPEPEPEPGQYFINPLYSDGFSHREKYNKGGIVHYTV